MENTVRNLMFDLAFNRDIYDDDKKISKAEANDTLRSACYDLLGVNAQSTEKQIKRALNSGETPWHTLRCLESHCS